MQRATVDFTGRVQGVGFRQTVLELARPLNLNGTVRNCSDGSVELIVEGDRTDIDRLLESISERMSRFIREIKIHRSAALGHFKGFNVKQ